MSPIIKLYIAESAFLANCIFHRVWSKPTLLLVLRTFFFFIWWLTAIGFVAVVATVVIVIAFQFRVDAFLPIGTSELVQWANHTQRWGAGFFVSFVATVVITIALFIYRYAHWIWAGFFAMKVVFLTRSINCKKNNNNKKKLTKKICKNIVAR